MAITAYSAWWFLPFVLPVCFYVVFTDLSQMKITNHATDLLAVIFVIVGMIALPTWGDYFWRYAHIAVMLAIGLLLFMGGAMGAGDAKFLVSASPYVALGDLKLVFMLLASSLLGAVVAHRVAKYCGLRRFAPNWKSWDMGQKFPMGFALGSSLGLYLVLGSLFGA